MIHVDFDFYMKSKSVLRYHFAKSIFILSKLLKIKKSKEDNNYGRK